jgi:hypothetical protein
MNPLQQASFRRKIYYLATILVLFTISMFWRGILSIPLSSSTARAGEARSGIQQAADRLNNANILNQARALDLRELEQGEPELTGEFVRLALSGSRGVAVTWLWYSLMDQQKRNDFHKMEQTIRSVTWLQPHFITPWIFQSWNISYNVSVEMQGSGDMYHYIARGIDLLAEGERRNTHTYQDRKIGSPDMRYQIAFYYQNKFGVSDQVEVLRCLFQLSCISPDERNPKNFIDQQTGAVNLPRFQEFCEKYPHLVRRLRGEDLEAAKSDEATKKKVQEALKCPRPEDIIQFLRENEEVLSRYARAKELADADKQFPALPPKFGNQDAPEANPSSQLDDDFTAYNAARAWYMYALLPVPPNPLDTYDEPLPCGLPTPATESGVIPPGKYDPFLYRVPRSPMLIIFRHGAPRVQSLQAEMEQKEGWFDDEGWRIDDPRDQPSKWWFPDTESRGSSRPLNVVVGTQKAWSRKAWEKSSEMWLKHGQENGLIVSEQRLQRYKENGQDATGRMPGDPNDSELVDREKRAKYEARVALFYYPQNRHVTNFPFFLASSQAEAKPETVSARKTLWRAEQARKLGRPEATQLYEEGLKKWKGVLAANKEFHRPERSERTEEDTFNFETSYLRLLVQDDEKVRAKANEIAHQMSYALRLSSTVFQYQPFPFTASVPYWSTGSTSFMGSAIAQSLASPFIVPEWKKDALEDLKWYVAETRFSPFATLMSAQDGVTDPERLGGPWIRPEVKNSIRSATGMQRRQANPFPANAPAPTAPQPTKN